MIFQRIFQNSIAINFLSWMVISWDASLRLQIICSKSTKRHWKWLFCCTNIEYFFHISSPFQSCQNLNVQHRWKSSCEPGIDNNEKINWTMISRPHMWFWTSFENEFRFQSWKQIRYTMDYYRNFKHDEPNSTESREWILNFHLHIHVAYLFCFVD